MLIEKSAQPYDSGLIGVISTKPGLILGSEDNAEFETNNRLVTLVGRVPLKVSAENGQILAGDYLTSSSQPGVAMRASEPGRVIGMALENYDGMISGNEQNLSESAEASGEGGKANATVGRIMVFVNPHWSLGSFTEDGSLAATDDGTTNNEAMNNKIASNEQPTILNQFTLAIKKSLEKLGLLIEDGIAQVKGLFAEKVRTNKLEMVDQATGEIYCTWIENGEWVKVKGECQAAEEQINEGTAGFRWTITS